MRKRILTITSLLLAATMVLGGCGAQGKNTTMTFGTGGTTGTYYTVGGTMSTVLNDIMESVDLKVVSTGASKANIFDVEDGVSDIAIVQNDVMYYAYEGTDLFQEDGVIDSFTAIGALYDETCQIVAASNINSIEDLKGKTVNVGDAGSGVEFNATQILAAYGLDINKDIKKVNGSFGDAADSIKDGKIDAAFITAGAPTTAVVDLSIAKDIKLLEIDDEHATQLMEQYPFYTKAVIPGGTYTGIDEDANTLSVKATLIASKDLSEDAVYELTKALFENKEALQKSNAKFAELNSETTTHGISIPFHPGAEKYLKEIGTIK